MSLLPENVRKGWVKDGIGYIPLTRGYITMVDAAMVKELQRWNWSAVIFNGKCYAYRRIRTGRGGVLIHMARQILGMDDSDKRHADHIDGNPLNNTIANLRPATYPQSQSNKPVRRDSGTGVKGVRVHKIHGVPTGKFQVRIKHMGAEIHLGLCSTLEEGSALYAKHARKLHGEFARIK